MVLMFQKEVAERIVAEPGTKAYGRLAVIAQWRTRAAAAVHAEARGLHAAALGRLGGGRVRAHRAPSPPARSRRWASVTAAAFGQRRKMLRQSLRSLLPDPEPLLAAAGIAADAARRGAHGARLRAPRLRLRALGAGASLTRDVAATPEKSDAGHLGSFAPPMQRILQQMQCKHAQFLRTTACREIGSKRAFRSLYFPNCLLS